MSFTILSRNSIEVLGLLENLEVDAGLTYLDNEPLGRVQTVPLYSEDYRLLASSDSPLGDRDQVTWAEVGKVPLCLLTPDMQNRRIIEQLLRQAGAEVAPTLESNSIVVLFAHVRTGKWASVMPAKLAEVLGLTEKVRAIPIVEPEVYAFDRAGGAASQPVDAVDQCLGQRSQAAGADPRRRHPDRQLAHQARGQGPCPLRSRPDLEC